MAYYNTSDTSTQVTRTRFSGQPLTALYSTTYDVNWNSDSAAASFSVLYAGVPNAVAFDIPPFGCAIVGGNASSAVGSDALGGTFLGRYNGVPLAYGLHIVVEDRSCGAELCIFHPWGVDTPLTIALPVTWQLALISVNVTALNSTMGAVSVVASQLTGALVTFNWTRILRGAVVSAYAVSAVALPVPSPSASSSNSAAASSASASNSQTAKTASSAFSVTVSGSASTSRTVTTTPTSQPSQAVSGSPGATQAQSALLQVSTTMPATASASVIVLPSPLPSIAPVSLSATSSPSPSEVAVSSDSSNVANFHSRSLIIGLSVAGSACVLIVAMSVWFFSRSAVFSCRRVRPLTATHEATAGPATSDVARRADGSQQPPGSDALPLELLDGSSMQSPIARVATSRALSSSYRHLKFDASQTRHIRVSPATATRVPVATPGPDSDEK